MHENAERHEVGFWVRGIWKWKRYRFYCETCGATGMYWYKALVVVQQQAVYHQVDVDFDVLMRIRASKDSVANPE